MILLRMEVHAGLVQKVRILLLPLSPGSTGMVWVVPGSSPSSDPKESVACHIYIYISEEC